MDQVAAQPVPLGGSPPLLSGGQTHTWPTSWPGYYIAPAPGGVPIASQRRAESHVAHKWARWQHNPCRLGGPCRFRVRGRIRSGPQVGLLATITPAASVVPTASERGLQSDVAHTWARWLHDTCCLRGPHRFTAGSSIRGGPQGGRESTYPLPLGGSPPLQSWGAESEVAHKRASWLHNRHRPGALHRFRAGGRIISGRQVGQVAA